MKKARRRSYTSFCSTSNIFTSDALSDEKFHVFRLSFLFSFSVSYMSFNSFGTLSHGNHLSGKSITHLTLYLLAFPSFLFEYRIVCSTLSLKSQSTEQKLARQRCHIDDQKGKWDEKDFTYTFAMCLFSVFFLLLLKSSMTSDVMLPLD